MKLWGGRFAADTDRLAEDFHSSISFDQRLYREDILGSQAHARMLAACGIIPPAEAEAIISGLAEISAAIEAGEVEFDVAAEDIHMNIEQLLTARIGDIGKKLHTARSRNDQVALDLRLYIRGETAAVNSLLAALIQTLLDLARQHIHTIMPGYTHLQKAQPVSLAHHLLAYAEMLRRDIGRLEDSSARMNLSPLGSGALAGTGFPIDREMTARELGFDSYTPNSMDGVSDRDFALEFIFALSLVMMHLSRFCEEIILWSSYEFGFITLDDAYSTGSSIMPQKKNPDMAELIRGKTGRVYGDLIALLTVMKGLPLAYNKDMQEDKPAVFDAADTVKSCLTVFTPMLRTMRPHPERMRQALAAGFINATDLADYLAEKGLPFREAHAVAGRLVRLAEERGQSLEQLELADFRAASPLFAADIYAAIALDACLAKRKSAGGPAPQAMERAIGAAEAWLRQREQY